MNLVRLSQVCRVVNGGTPKSGVTEYWGGDVAWLTPAEMGKLDTPEIGATVRTITDSGLKNSSAKQVPVGSVILSTRAPIGHLAIAIAPMAFNQGCRGLVPNESLDTKYLYYFLWFSREALNDLGTGTTFKELSSGALGAYRIPLPPLKEQRRIVAVLDETFAAIATAKTNAEKNLANAWDAFRAEREQVLSRGQAGWREASLRDLCSVKHGFAFKSEYFTEAGDYILLTPGNFYETGGYRDRGQKQKYYDGPVPSGFVLKAGSLLVAMTEQAAGLLGSPIIVPPDGQFLHNQRLGLVLPHAGVEWDNRYFFHVFNTQNVRTELHNTGTGVKVRHTSPEKIGRLQVAFPTTLTEQRRVAEWLDLLSDEFCTLAQLQERKLAELEDLGRAILASAFAGKLSEREPLAA